MLEKSMYDSWASRIRLFIKGKKQELTKAQQLQDDCDVQATNIILYCLPPNVYALVNHQEAAKDIWDKVKLIMKGTELSYQERECRLYNLFDKFASVQGETLYEYYQRFSQLINDMHTIGMTMQQQGEDPIDCINKAMAFLSDVASRFPPSNNQLKMSSNPRNLATIQDGRVTVQQIQERQTQSFAGTGNREISTTSMGNYAASQPRIFKEKLMLVEAQEAGQILDEEQLAFLADPGIEEAQVPYSDTYPNDMINLDVQEMKYYEQTHIVDFLDNEINNDSNIIPYSQYLQESQDAGIQDTNYSVPNDLLVLYLVKQMTDHVANLDKENQTNKNEQAFWLKHSSIFETPVKSHTPIRIEARGELPKVSLVNASLNKLKYHLACFDKVVKKRTTSNVITADEITEVQIVFNQMEAAVDQCSKDKNDFEIKIKRFSIDNDQLLNQIMSQEIMHIAVNSVDILDVNKLCVDECNKCLELETELLKKKDFIEKDDNSGENQNAPTFNQLFEINELKAQSQEKDTVIRKLKDRIKSLSGKESIENVKKDIDKIETVNIELEHSVAKLLSENENLRKEREHLKSIYKDHFDLIKMTRVRSKEYSDSLISQINAKSVDNSDLNAQLQEKVFAIAALKNELRKLKGKNIVDTIVSKPIATNIVPGMFNLDIKPISHRLKNNRDAHEEYLKKL
ncbi:hypothetical protein Tco_0826117 [Tanacetum coccineum]